MQTRMAGRNCTYRAAQFPQEQMGHLYPLHMNTYLWETSTNYIMEYKLHLHDMYYLRKLAASHMQGSAVYPGGGDDIIEYDKDRSRRSQGEGPCT